MENTEQNKKVIKLILGKKKQPKLSDDFTQKVMQRVLTIELTKKRDIRRSWLLLFVGIFAFLISLTILSKIGIIVSPVFDNLLPGLFNYYLFAIATIISIIFFYQLNNLISIRVSIT